MLKILKDNMDWYSDKYYKSVKNPPVSTIGEYLKATSPSKHNTLLSSEDESFLKEIYHIEINQEWRKMCLNKIEDKDFLEEVARKDTSPRVRKWAARKCDRETLTISPRNPLALAGDELDNLTYS